jgi:hypothetical protein
LRFFFCRWRKIQTEFIRAEEAVAKLPEFRALDEFAVMYQPFSKNLSVCNHPAFDVLLFFTLLFTFFIRVAINCNTL